MPGRSPARSARPASPRPGGSVTAPPPAARPPGAAATKTRQPALQSPPPGPGASSPSTNARAAGSASTASSAAPTAASSLPASAPAGPARTAANPSPSPTCSRRWSPRLPTDSLSNDSLSAQPTGEFQRSTLGNFQDRRQRLGERARVQPFWCFGLDAVAVAEGGECVQEGRD